MNTEKKLTSLKSRKLVRFEEDASNSKPSQFLDNSYVGKTTKICVNDEMQKYKRRLKNNSFSKNMDVSYIIEHGVSNT